MDWIKKDNVGWVDLLRIIAIFAVVYSHSCDFFIAQFNNDRTSFLTGLFMESIGRPCVVLMVMISGHLLLPIKQGYTLGGYYRKRIGRIIVPLVFWSLVLPVAFYVYYRYFGQNTDNPAIVASTFTLESMINHMYTFIFNFSYEGTPLWYLYMLIGLYLALPIVNSWLVQATKKDLQTVLCLWAATLLLPYLKVIVPLLGGSGEAGFAPIFGECAWNFYGSFYYMSGFLGYMLLAYYLKTYPPNWNWRKTLAVAIPVYLAGYAVTSFGYIYVNNLFPGDYKYLEIPWYMCGLNVAMQAFGVYVIFAKIKVTSRPWLSKAAAMMFGIYLCHFPIVHIAYDWFHRPELPLPIQILLIASISFVISYIVTRLLYSMPVTRKLVK